MNLSPDREGILKIVRSPRMILEHRMGFEPMNTGFADQRVSHFAIGARDSRALPESASTHAECLLEPLLWLRRGTQVRLDCLVAGKDFVRLFV
jgi:hypothetical protein